MFVPEKTQFRLQFRNSFDVSWSIICGVKIFLIAEACISIIKEKQPNKHLKHANKHRAVTRSHFNSQDRN